MRRSFVLASLVALTVIPGRATAQYRDRDRDRRERDRGERVRVRVYRDHDRARGPSRDLSLVVGALNYDFSDDRNFPTAALRANWRLTRHLRSEVDVAYATGDVPAPGGTGDERNSSLLAGTVGIQAELPFRFIRPYVGAAAGLFGRFDSGSGGTSSVRPTHAFPVGVRIPFSPRLALRAEARFRFDQHDNNTTAANVEQTAGLSFGF